MCVHIFVRIRPRPIGNDSNFIFRLPKVDRGITFNDDLVLRKQNYK